MDVTEGVIDVPGGSVWYRVSEGKGNGAPLLCLHGGPGFPHDYLSSLSALAKSRSVVFFDQLGCGRSARPGDEGLWTLDRSISEVDAVARSLGLSEFHLFGNSFGGLLAIEYALTRPNGLRSLVLSSPLVSVPRWVDDANRLRSRLPGAVRDALTRHETRGYVDCPEYTAASLVFLKRHVCRLVPWPDEVEASYSGLGVDVYRTMWGPSEFTQTGNLEGHDPSEQISTLNLPSLWTCGKYDEARPESTKYFASLVPNSEFMVFQNSSHMAHLEEPAAYLSAVKNFLAGVDEDYRLGMPPS